jgi:NADH dehydrogenase (ubiquinone) 1 alpha subcomplex subunit 9
VTTNDSQIQDEFSYGVLILRNIQTIEGANGFMTYIGNRGDDMEMRDRRIQFDLGRLRTVFYSPRDLDSVREVIADADVVVNMIGKYYESGQPVQTKKFPYLGYETNYSFEETNVTIARNIAEICKEMQVDHLIHVSSASANPESKSRWSRTKYEGEMAVKEAFPWATIVRPTHMFGKDDFILSWYAKAQQNIRCVPMIYAPGGREALTQPVWVGDVAKAIFSVCDDPAKFEGRQIDCFGPADYTRSELYKFVNDITERNRPVLTIPADIYRQIAKVAQYTRNPLVTPDLVEQWLEDFLPTLAPEEYKLQTDPATKILTLEDFGIQPMPIEREAFMYLHFYRFGGHFHRVRGYH